MKKGLMGMLPFLDEEDVDKLAEQAVNGEGEISFETLLPFMSHSKVDELFNKMFAEGKEVISMLPFVSKKVLDEAVKNAQTKDENIAIFLPFLGKETIDEMFSKSIADGKSVHIFYPFVSDECLDKAVDDYISNEGECNLDVDSLYPFLSNASIKKLFQYEIGRRTKKVSEGI